MLSISYLLKINIKQFKKHLQKIVISGKILELNAMTKKSKQITAFRERST